jgi:hypothetical protein
VIRKIIAAAARIAHEGIGTLTLGNMAVTRDWGWVPDYVEAMIRAATAEHPDDYVIAIGEGHTVEGSSQRPSPPPESTTGVSMCGWIRRCSTRLKPPRLWEAPARPPWLCGGRQQFVPPKP